MPISPIPNSPGNKDPFGIGKMLGSIKISSSSQSTGEEGNKGTLEGLTSREIHITNTERVIEPIDLVTEKLREIGLDSPVAKLQRGVVRLRVELNGETIGGGSGFIISSDGAILSVNHVPAIGKQGGESAFDFISGRKVLNNMKAWSELLGQKGEARLVADIPLLPQPEPPNTIFTPKNAAQMKVVSIWDKHDSGSKGATAYYPFYDGGIECLTVPVRILNEDPGRDLMLAVIDLPEPKDPYPFVKVTDAVPRQGQFVYSIGHPLGIRHNALALGEVMDPDFDVTKLAKALEAHGIIAGGISAALGGKSFGSKGITSQVARMLSLQLAGVDVEPLANFLNGAIMSTNRITHGNSGGLLAISNESGEGEAVGVTYIGLPLPTDSWILRYAAGVLGFNTHELPISSVAGSVGMKKAIPFLEKNGVNTTRARDGEPVGVKTLGQRADRERARSAMRTFIIGQAKTEGNDLTEDEVERALSNLGLGKNEGSSTTSSATSQTTSDSTCESPYFIKGFGGKRIPISSKPVSITSFDVKLGDVLIPEGHRNLVFSIGLQTEDGQGFKIKDLEVCPISFNPEDDLDPTTKQVLLSYLMENTDKLTELSDLQEKAKKKNGDNNPPLVELV